MAMKGLNVILTSPHAKCDLMAEKRGCDFAAALAGKSMCMAMDKCKLKYTYLPGDEYRKDHDLNRKPSRATKYRTNLELIMKDLSGSPCLLLDIHSFPDYYMDEAGDINFFAKDEVAPDVVFLQGPNNSYNGHSLTDLLSTAASKAKLKTKIIKGIVVNDIMNHANEHSIPSVLIEFNEKYNNDPEKLDKLCLLLSKTICKTYPYK
jgi:hypothetical protein